MPDAVRAQRALSGLDGNGGRRKGLGGLARDGGLAGVGGLAAVRVIAAVVGLVTVGVPDRGVRAQCRLPDIDTAGTSAAALADIATDGDFAVVGFPEEHRVRVFRLERSRWVPDATIEGPARIRFGESVALSDGWLAIGAPETREEGTVYLYRREDGRWRHRASVDAPDPRGRFFGRRIHLEGEWLVVARSTPLYRKDLHVFRRLGDSTWREHSTIAGIRGAASSSSEISGDGRCLADFAPSFGTRIFEWEAERGWQETFSLERTFFPAVLRGDELVVVEWQPEAGQYVPVRYERGPGGWTRTDEIGLGTMSRAPRSIVLEDRRMLISTPVETRLLRRNDAGGRWEYVGTLLFDEVGDRLWTDAAMKNGVAIITNGRGRMSTFDVRAGDCASICRTGSVNAGTGAPVDTLFLDGEVGGTDRRIEIAAEDPWLLYALRPPAGGEGTFVVHAHTRAPAADDPVLLPGDHGLSCFTPFLSEGARPDAVWNNVGFASRIGASLYFDGTPIPDPPPAPAILLQLDAGDPAHLPPGTVVTFQGLIRDPAALGRRAFSPTNALVVDVR